MLVSPFGEKFHFRTALPITECQSRIDDLGAAIFGETNYSGQPVSSRWKNRFTLWETQCMQPPRLSGKIFTNKGWTEISGRGGANIASLLAAIGMAITFAAVSFQLSLFEAGFSDILIVVGVCAVSMIFIYWRLWEDPNAGHLIDELQSLLEAETLPTKPR
jgi:hypothetical protein